MKFSELLEDSRFNGPSRRDIRGGDLAWHRSVEDDRARAASPAAEREALTRKNLAAAKEKLAKQKSFVGRLKSFLEKKSASRTFRISESFDMNDVVSRLAGMENANSGDSATVSYGVEDDEGNLMKVTVRAEQAEEFEKRLADELADAQRRKEVTDSKTSISMAELLYNLNSEFDIVDVQFPTIPTDAVYNADKVQYGIADTAQEEIGGDMGGDLGAQDDLAGFPESPDAMGGADAGAAGGDLPPLEGEGGELPPLDGEGGEGGEDAFFDDESVEDFPEEVEDTNANPESLLTSILNMLKSDSEARKAEADARAEEARAKQAEYTAIATAKAVEEQEEIARMEAEMDKQKQQEKEARRIADLAKYRVNKASSTASSGKVAFAGTRTFGESANAHPTFAQYLDLMLEADEFDTMQSLQREKSNIRVKYAVQNGDDADTIAYKREAMAAANVEITAKMRRVRAAERYKARMAQKDKEANTQQAKPQQQQQPAPQAQQSATGTPAVN